MIGGGDMSPCQTQLHMYYCQKKTPYVFTWIGRIFWFHVCTHIFWQEKKDMHGMGEEKRNLLHASIYYLNTTVLNEATRRV
jgi:hypothetical protein